MLISVYLYSNGVAIHYFDGKQSNGFTHTVKKIEFPAHMRKQIVEMVNSNYENIHPNLNICYFPTLALEEGRDSEGEPKFMSRL